MYNSLRRAMPPMVLLHRGALTILGVAMLTLSAKLHLPFWPVPMTLQTLAVLGFAVFLGGRAAMGMMAAYLLAGAAGLPVFSGTPERGIGLAYMVGPTGGYLLGYLLASGLVGQLAARYRSFIGRLAAMLIGLLPIYGFGAVWLTLYVPTEKLWAVGVAPFLLGDLLKIALIAMGGSAIGRLSRAKGPSA